jgi:aldose 1-epimerase
MHQACSNLAIDHCFEGWVDTLKIEDEQFAIKVKSNLHRLVIYTHPGLDSIAVEPVSHVNNAINMNVLRPDSENKYGITVLEPGESISAYMSIEIEKGSV